MTVYYYSSFAAAILLTAFILRILIPILKSKKMGQKILDIGPRWHKSKEGTPTMGGLSFLISFAVVATVAIIVSVCFRAADNIEMIIITGAFALGNGLIGIIDDRTKFSKGQNEGLLSWQKYLLQLLLCIIYLFFLKKYDLISTSVYVPFFKQNLELGIIYYPFAVLLITGIINSVNLTDGIDGLAASQTAIVSAFFSVVAFVNQSVSLGIFSGIIIGCCLGFLIYNFYPAKIFMGDTGSLFLGAAVVGMAFMSSNPLIIIIVGFIFICESLSDIIQVSYFKISHGKRVFKMAPIHHHFEKCGWSEIKIVSIFSLITAVLCIVSYFFDIL